MCLYPLPRHVFQRVAIVQLSQEAPTACVESVLPSAPPGRVHAHYNNNERALLGAASQVLPWSVHFKWVNSVGYD